MTESAPQPTSEYKFDLSGGRLCLDFANTVGGKRATSPIEHLHRYADLLSWGRQVGIMGEECIQQLLSESERHPKLAAAVLEHSKELRDAIFRIFLAVVRAERPAKTDLELLNQELSKALSHQRLVKAKGKWVLGWGDQQQMDSILWPVAKSAAEVLTSEEASRLRVCEANLSQECDWLFIDETRNCSRRWCSMKDCGNRAKARRHYQRQRKSR
jgi:predicted RNA-binding Zn ribbon-like protein